MQILKYITFLTLLSNIAFAQTSQRFTGLKSDEAIEGRYSRFISQSYTDAIHQPRSSYKKDIKRFYKTRYNSAKHRLENGHFLMNKDLDEYFLGLKETLASANPEFEFDKVELIMSRYSWPNAFSTGDGTLVVNVGLLTHLQNESQLAFVVCHEAAHFFLNHSDEDFIRRFNAKNSQEFKDQLNEIQKSEYYQVTQLKALLKSNIYSERHHSRTHEYQADSLGMLMYTNAGYSAEGALKTLETLDVLNEPFEYNINIFEIFSIDTVTYPTSDFISNDASKEDILHDDSIKTHPDISKRIKTIKTNYNGANSGLNHESSDFTRFHDIVLGEEIHSMFFFNQLDQALLKSLYKKENGDNSEEVNTAIILALQKLAIARKDHTLSRYINKPSEHQSKAENDLSKLTYSLRYRVLCKSFLAYSLSIYPDARNDDRTLLALINLANISRDQKQFDILKEKFIHNYTDSPFFYKVKELEY